MGSGVRGMARKGKSRLFYFVFLSKADTVSERERSPAQPPGNLEHISGSDPLTSAKQARFERNLVWSTKTAGCQRKQVQTFRWEQYIETYVHLYTWPESQRVTRGQEPTGSVPYETTKLLYPTGFSMPAFMSLTVTQSADCQRVRQTSAGKGK